MSTHEGFARCFSRRQLLRLVGLSGGVVLAAACSGTAPQQQAPAQSTVAVASKTWDDVVVAAKKEGVVSIATYAGTGYRKVMDDFEAAFPGVKVEQTGFQSSSRHFVPRLLQERTASLYLWDIAVMPSPEMLIQVNPVGGLDPFRPLIIHPEVLNDANWSDGFNGGFVDTAKQLSYAITRARSQSLWIDTNQVRDDEIRSYKDLLDPRWKGKLFAGDLRTKGSGYNTGTTLRLKAGDAEILRKIYKDQDAVLSTDARQLTEFAVRGAYPISLGAVSKAILLDFLARGVGKNVKCIPCPTSTISTAAPICSTWSTKRRTPPPPGCSRTGCSRKKAVARLPGTCRTTAAASTCPCSTRTPFPKRASATPCSTRRRSCPSSRKRRTWPKRCSTEYAANS